MGWAFGPPLATQQAIVAGIQAEQALVATNGELLTRFDRKIQATLAHTWAKKRPPESQRDSIIQPRVGEPASLPWVRRFNSPPTPTGLHPTAHRNDATPLGLKMILLHLPRVARASQPWADGLNPVGIPTDLRSARSWPGSKPSKPSSPRTGNCSPVLIVRSKPPSPASGAKKRPRHSMSQCGVTA